MGQIICSPTDLNAIGKHLIRLTLGVHRVGGTQDRVPGNDLIEGGAQACLVQGAREPVGDANVQRNVACVHGLQEPHPPLAGRQTVTFSRTDPHQLDRLPRRQTAFGDAPT